MDKTILNKETFAHVKNGFRTTVVRWFNSSRLQYNHLFFVYLK
jgi:hypothetical protein